MQTLNIKRIFENITSTYMYWKKLQMNDIAPLIWVVPYKYFMNCHEMWHMTFEFEYSIIKNMYDRVYSIFFLNIQTKLSNERYLFF